MLLYQIIYIFNLIYFINCFHLPIRLTNKYNNIKNKILDLWKSHYGKHLHIDISELEYPKGNKTLRNIYQKLWNEYYDCLKKQYLSIGELRTLHPIALSAFQGTSVVIRCNICQSPYDIYTLQSANWFYRNVRDIYADNVEIIMTENIIISSDGHTLTLYNVQSSQEGLYWCKMIDTLSTPYYLNIADESEPIINVKPDTAPNSTHVKLSIIIPKYNLKVFSSWTLWSSCSVCDKVGIRIRYGYCTFSSLNYSNLIINRNIHLNIYEKDLKKIIEDLLIVFKNKMPCRSWFTPKKVQEISEIKNRKTEIMKQFCKVKCPRNVIFEIRDNKGRIIESANNSAGIYSPVQGMPESQPFSHRITIYQKYGKSIKLKCPGNLNFNYPIIWKIGSKEMNPKTIKSQSNKRIYIDSLQRIVFKKVRYADINIYSCWQRSALVGIIRLQVSYDVSSKLNHQIIIFTGIPIILVILYIFWRAWRGRNYDVKR